MAAALLGLVAAPAAARDRTLANPPAPVSGWTGWYAGVNAGYGWSDGNVDLAPNDKAAAQIFPPPIGLAFVGSTLVQGQSNATGGLGGFQVGYNRQFANKWVAGIEADFDFSGVKGNSAAVGVLGPAALPPGSPQTIATSTELKWFGTVRGRLGYLANDSLLLFATGGLAYGQVNQSGTYALGPGGAVTGITNLPFGFLCAATLAAGTPCFANSQNQTNVGWTAGVGGEWMLWKNWSVKAEYLFIDLGNRSYNLVSPSAGGGTIPASLNVSNQLQYHFVRAGLNWHF